MTAASSLGRPRTVRVRPFVTGALLALVAVAADCASPPAGSTPAASTSGASTAAAPAPAVPARPASSRAGVRPDLILLTIDTLRADAVGFDGNQSGTTPLLDRFAAGGRVFTNAHAHNVITLPSHTNILTGLFPYQHGVRENTGFKLGKAIPTIATVLHDAGYATGAFVGGYPLSAQFGLTRGFDVYDDRFTSGGLDDQFALAERRGDEVVKSALAWWHRPSGGKPRFLWVHLYDPHAPYQPPASFAQRFPDPYLGEVAAADSYLEPLLEPLLAANAAPTFLVMTADHGEARGEHGEQTHGLFAYEGTLHVPLFIWGPGIAPGRDDRPAAHMDVFPSLLQAAGVSAPADGRTRHGRSLLRAWTPAEQRADLYFESLSTALNRGWAPLRGMLRIAPSGAQRKFIHLPLPELYELPRDPHERNNLVDADRPAVRAAFAALPRESTWPPPREAVSSEEAARLRSLGYVSDSGGTTIAFAPQDDPKNLVDLDRKIEQLIDAYSRHKVPEAIALGRELVQARPSMPLGHSLYAQALLEAGRDDEALQVMREARRQRVASPTLLRQLGLTLAERGIIDEARAVLSPLAAADDAEAEVALATADSEAGQQREALARLERVLAADPRDAGAWETSALVHLRLQRWAKARDAARRAVDLQTVRPRAWNDLGVALFQLDDVPGALDAWQRAVELDPRLWDALWNLGIQASNHGRPAVARAALQRFLDAAPRDRYGNDMAEARRLLAALPAGS
ncbi:MAG TPA: sulfatase-like hydrolase/transferase [Thermoanaerobaculia bacterium]|jgi:arylsulfatase A-like enzyme|nr:sulfatase-like hydrolase/transferase [Thermoanaerobaculia bacterium]